MNKIIDRLTQEMLESVNAPKCKWCGKRFHPVRRRQKFCCIQHGKTFSNRQRYRCRSPKKYAKASGPYKNKWRRLRGIFLKKNKFCVMCKRHKMRVSATVVDHIKPHRGGLELFWDQKRSEEHTSELQS